MKARFLLILCGVLLMAACAASAVKTNIPETSRYAPADKFDGIVSYFDAGLMAVRYAGRKDAYKKMHEYCGGAYKIVWEEAQKGGCLQAAQRRIWFRCLDSDTGDAGVK